MSLCLLIESRAIAQAASRSGVQTEIVSFTKSISTLTPAARSSDSDEWALKLRIRPRRQIVKRQPSTEDHPERRQMQRLDITYQPQVGIPNRYRNSPSYCSDDHGRGHSTLVGIEPRLDQVVPPRIGLAPVAGVENPIGGRGWRRWIQECRFRQHDGQDFGPVGQRRCPRAVSPAMKRQLIDEQRHRRALPSVVISVPGFGAEDHLGHQRLDAEDDEVLSLQSSFEAVLIKLVFDCRKANRALALKSHPLPGTFRPKLRQIPFEGPQRLLPQILLLLHRHDVLHFLVDHVQRSKLRDSHFTRKSVSKAHPLAGTVARSAIRPSAIVGCVRMESREAV
jgi:hypothetical protein